MAFSLASLSGCNCTGVVAPDGGGPDTPEPGAGPEADDGGVPVDGGGEPEDDAGTTGPTDPIRDPNPNDPNNPNLDSDCDGISDAEEYQTTYAGGARTDPADYDSDDDGIADGVEAGRTEVIDPECPSTWQDQDPSTTTNPTVADSDSDCIIDGDEDRNFNGRVDDGESNPNAVDSDGDTLLDGDEDQNCNGVTDPGETSAGRADTDGDGIRDGIEINVTNTDPLNPDSDGDGIPDGNEDINQNGVVDEGETDPNVPDLDSDGDGIADDREIALGYDPNNADMDGDGLCDGPTAVPGICDSGEDLDGDGFLAPGETDPFEPDTDCDAVSDGEERSLGLDPRLADTDGDLLRDGIELGKTAPVPGGCATALVDADGSTTTDPNLVDSDRDGLNDGIEDRNRDGALAAANPGGVQETDPGNADTDGDGICDGPRTVSGLCEAGEDLNRNGRVDADETDPRVPNVDSDGDGLSDQTEAELGTNPNVADTDGDGLSDGVEVQVEGTLPLSADTDCDGVSDGEEVTLTLDPLDRDTDGDGITDGVELGRTAVLDPTRCTDQVIDADPATTTDPLNPDSDNDGVVDGAEDGNQNGRTDPGELNPNDPNDAGGAIGAACATPITPVFHARQAADVLIATAPEFAAGNAGDITLDGDVVGVSVTSPASGLFAFAIAKVPEQVDPSSELSVYEGRINNLTLPLRQTFTTWDGFAAIRGTFNLADNGANTADRAAQVVRRIFNRGQNNQGVVVPFPGGNPEGGPFKLGLEVVRRSDQTVVIVGVLTNLDQYENVSTGRSFRFEDIFGGTALAQVGDATAQQCDVRVAEADQPVDIIWVVDNSGSMEDAQDAVVAARDAMIGVLENSTLDWRLAVVSSEFNLRASGPTFNGIQGSCTFNGVANMTGAGTRGCICKFTTDANAFAGCIESLGLAGSGAEGTYEPLKQSLNTVYLNPGQDVAGRLRDGARLVVIALTDAGEQSPQSPGARTPYSGTIEEWTNFALGGSNATSWDPGRNDEPPLILGGIFCPPGVVCSGEENTPESMQRYSEVFSVLGGVTGDIANNQGDGPDCGNPNNPACVQFRSDIEATVVGIMDSVIGQVSPYELSRDPIASTLKVALEGPVLNPGACDVGNLPRSRDDGFSYDAATNRIAFFGACRPQAEGSEIAVSYRTWIDLTGDPDGADQPCGGECVDPFVCVNDQCLCPSDCGTGAPLEENFTCNAQECVPECLPDCGGICGAGQVCDTDSCGCTCPEDCNGERPGPDFVCDPGTCQWTCPEDGCEGAPPGDNFVCGAQCEWECPADCGGDLSPTERCNFTTCEGECAPDCNAACTGFETCNSDSCECECVENATCAPGFVFDADACGCVCDVGALACPATHEADLDSCTCSCGTDDNGTVDCNGCATGSVCSASTCQCVNAGG